MIDLKEVIECQRCGRLMGTEELVVEDEHGQLLIIRLSELVDRSYNVDPYTTVYTAVPITACPHCVLKYLAQYIKGTEVVQ